MGCADLHKLVSALYSSETNGKLLLGKSQLSKAGCECNILWDIQQLLKMWQQLCAELVLDVVLQGGSASYC